MRKTVNVLLAALVFCLAAVWPAYARTPGLGLLEDRAGLLSSSQAEKLESDLEQYGEAQAFDVVILTVDGLDGKSPAQFADDFYDENGYGGGDNQDGILLLVSMEERDWYISTNGFGVTAFTDAGLDYMAEKFLPYLSEGDYEKAFRTYFSLCEGFVKQARKGTPYDTGHMPREQVSPVWIPLSLLIGFVLAWLILRGMRGQLRSVRRQDAASVYIRPGSRNITQSSDRYLFSNVTRKAKPKENTSRGSSRGSTGSTTHRSSSGRSHGGRGGKF